MTSLLDRLDRLALLASSPDGNLSARMNFDRHVTFSWDNASSFDGYSAESLAYQVAEVLRAAACGHRAGVRRAFELEGRADELANDTHWDANYRRFEKRLAGTNLVGTSDRKAVVIMAPGTLAAYKARIHPQALSKLNAGDLVIELDSAYQSLLDDYRRKRFELTKEHFPD